MRRRADARAGGEPERRARDGDAASRLSSAGPAADAMRERPRNGRALEAAVAVRSQVLPPAGGITHSIPDFRSVCAGGPLERCSVSRADVDVALAA